MSVPEERPARRLRALRLSDWRLLWENRTLGEKLVLSVWLSLVPISLATSMAAMATVERLTLQQLRVEMLRQAREANRRFSAWEKEHLSSLQFLAQLRSISSLNPEDSARTLSTAGQSYPRYSFFLKASDGSPIASSPEDLQNKILNKVEQRALTGMVSNGLISNGLITNGLISDQSNHFSCFGSSVPVRTNRFPQEVPKGVLSSCIAINELGRVTGVDDLRSHFNEENSDTPRLDLVRGNTRGIAMFQVLRPGLMLLLESRGYSQEERERLLDPRESLKSAWAPFIRYAMNQNRTMEDFAKFRIDGKVYYAAIDQHNNNQSSLFIIDQETVFEGVHRLFTWLWAGNIAALVASSVAIVRICKSLSQPIDRVGMVLERISQGDFSLELPAARGPQGQLFSYVNRASAQLKAYLADSEALTVTNAQLYQARRIQDDFLIQNLPCSNTVDLAASFNPAYEIGADWYDALTAHPFTIVVVADVCDKGVPSALYMSVFRSLLRLNLQREFSVADGDADSKLRQALMSVNRYMVDNHGSTGMFATAFVGAYDPGQHRLSYVVAGHESPLIHQRGVVSALTLGGPALGLFAQATFQPGHCQLDPGSYLLAFSDGLPDARNSHGDAFGHANVRALFAQLAGAEPSAQSLLDGVSAAALSHIGEAEQFDDLTLLTLRVKGGT
jgi:serine phosphatase RsbU (regulator of sigma subunit)